MPPLDELILPGITRAIIETVCNENDIPVKHTIFTIDEIKTADEIILCSTTKNVIYVFDIDGQKVGGKDRVLAQKIQDLFSEKVFKDTGVRL
jgi:D-alanine transaminase